MKTLYEASSTVEGHMLQDLLQQEGISARLDGAFLQGAMGGLPASGLVRLVVDEADYEKGRTIIERWEAAEPLTQPIPTTTNRSSGRLLAALMGMLIGVAGTYAFLRSPVSVNGIDHNRDGVLDEQWKLSPSGAVLDASADRNLDGKFDHVVHHDQRGHVETAESDDDFDGKFESTYHFRFGNVTSTTTDTDGDGFADLHSYYKHGVLVTTKYMNTRTGLPLRVEHIQLGRVVSAEVDSDKNGTLDKRLTYSVSGEVTQSEDIDSPK
ncbi:MAG: DUF2007 domain-containing protein [Pseudomonadota bacterium]